MIFRPFKALIFSLLVASLFLSACQGGTAVPTPTPQPTQPNPPPPVEVPAVTLTPTLAPTATPLPRRSIKGLEIEFWYPWQGDLTKRAEDLVAEFNRYNEWGISVKARSFYNTSALNDALEAAWQQNGLGLPALVAAPSDLLAAWAQDGRITALNTYLEDPQYGLSAEEVKNYNPLYWAQDQAGGKQVGIPALRSAQVIYYNRTWASELGFTTPPTTPEQFQQQACAAAKANNRSRYLEMRGTGGYLVDTDSLTALSWMSAFGAKVVPQGETLAYTFQSAESKAALAYLRKLLDTGCAWVGRSPTPNAYFARRMALFFSGPLTDLADQQRVLSIEKNNDQWAVLPFPGEGGKPVVYAGGDSYAVIKPAVPSPASDDARTAAWLLARWMAKPKNAARLAEAEPSLPVSQGVQAELQHNASQFPWDQVFQISAASSDAIRPAPGLASWREVRRLLEDGMHQAYYQPAEQLDLILPMLDQMAQEVVKK